jgi:hypothetical protein
VRPCTSLLNTSTRAFALASGLIIAGFAVLQVAPPASSQTGPDWVQLFDGRSLNGRDEAGTANWRVEDGTIMADKSTAPPGAKGQAGGGGRHCQPPRDCGRWLAAGSTTRETALLLFQLSPRHRKHNLPDQLRVRPSSDRNGIA